MKKERMLELGRKRYGQVSVAEIFTSTVMGVFSLWVIWVSTSMLIHFMK